MADPNEEFEAFTILNAQGEIWTRRPFDTENAAENYISNCAASWAKNGLKNHKIVPCMVTIKPISQ